MNIKTKLNIIIALVLVFSLTIVGVAINKAIVQKNFITQSKELNVLSQKLSLLIHETQKERGASAGFIGSHGKKFTTILPKQRILTNKKLSELNSYIKTLDLNTFSNNLKSAILSFQNAISRLNTVRSQVTHLNISLKNEVAYYTNTNAKILHIVDLTAKLANTPKLVKALGSYSNFLKSKERAGVERAVLSGTFAANKFAPGMFAKWVSLVAEQNSYLDSSMSMASLKVKRYYKNKMNSPVIKEVNKMRAIAMKKAIVGNFNVSSVKWFKTITKKINILKAIDDEMARQNNLLLDKLKSESIHKTTTVLISYILFSIILIGIILTIGRGINKSVGTSLNKIKCVSSSTTCYDCSI